VRAADAVIAIGGGWGTLSEVALAMKMGKRVIGLDTWELSQEGVSVDGILRAESPEDAVRLALERA
jgi:predicted Rossmann-fold nucleotide-binding protein